MRVGGSTFSIKKGDGLCVERKTFSRDDKISTRGNSWGYSKFATFKDVFASYLTNDTLTIQAKIKLHSCKKLSLVTQ